MPHKTVLVVCLLLTAVSTAFADGAASGTDMWTRMFEQWGLFTPHEDYCDSSTEEFIAVSGSASRGFCIEKDERSAANWETARDACAADKKRLPEPGEWKFACNNGVSLSNMTDDWEWSSNFGLSIITTANVAAYVAVISGSGACYRASNGHIGHASSSESSLVYRCVR